MDLSAQEVQLSQEMEELQHHSTDSNSTDPSSMSSSEEEEDESVGEEAGTSNQAALANMSSFARLTQSLKEEKGQHQVANPICLDFVNISYSVKLPHGGPANFFRHTLKKEKREKKELLHSMSGRFIPGRVAAIMGPSGAGKSTFLNFLSGRIRGGKTSGKVLLNGRKRDSDFKYLSAYVMQDDTLLPNLTPRELLRYAARLRLPASMSNKEKDQRVETVIEELGLQKCANTQVGQVGIKRGISGGERRRVSIGLELLTNPQLLFLDEPTSGLDSATAESVIIMLKRLARQGRTIICTIHQPSSEIFQAFDDLFLVVNGHLAYAGPVEESKNYFNDLGFPCPKFTNPSDHFMRLLTKTEDKTEEQHTEQVQTIVQAFKDHQNKNNFLEQDSGLPPPPEADYRKATWYLQFWILLSRSWLQYIRDPSMTHQRLVQNIMVGLITGLLWLQTDDNQRGYIDRMGAIFLVLIYSVFATGNSILYVFPLERPTFLREYNNGMYSVLPYYLAKSLADLPFNIVNPIVFGSIVYWMVGLQAEADKFFIYLATVIIITNIAQTKGLLVSVGLDLKASLALFPVTVIPMLLVGGFFLNVENTPPYFIWLQYISYFFYAFMVLGINEFEDGNFYCDSDELQNGECPVTTGEQVLEDRGLDDFEIWIGFVGMIGLFVVLRFMTYFALLLLAKKASST
ncbi:putative ATP-dependent permease ADP1 [Balamuthia mandrillaris]